MATQDATPRRSRRQVRSLLFRIGAFSVAAVALYLLAPGLIELFSSASLLRDLSPWAVALMVVFEALSFVAAWAAFRVALPESGWFVTATSQLTSNAISRVIPGGAVTGGATQFAMLNKAGIDATTAGAALTANSLISTGALFALPVLALPAALSGREIPDTLASAARVGAGVFVVLTVVFVVLTAFDRPLLVIGSWLTRVRKRVAPRVEGQSLGEQFIERRNEVRTELGSRWRSAAVTSVANWIFDYLALLAAVQAVGSDAPPSLVLLAYVAASVLTMVPITPGGLGFVEAGLTATLTAAGLAAPDALLATLAYRLVSYWLPLPAGLVAYQLFRSRYGADPENPAEQTAPTRKIIAER